MLHHNYRRRNFSRIEKVKLFDLKKMGAFISLYLLLTLSAVAFSVKPPDTILAIVFSFDCAWRASLAEP